MQKQLQKNSQYSINDSFSKIAKIGHYTWGIVFAKWSLWIQNKNSQKRPNNDSAITLELFCAKNGSKKYLILEKSQLFKNGQDWPLYKGYSLTKMISLGPKLKFPKTSDKRLYTHTRVVLRKKRLEKTPNIRQMRQFCKLATLQRL